MAAYLIVLISVHDPAWFADYVAAVPTILRKYGGEYLAVSQRVVQLEGTGTAPDQIAIFTFPSIEQAQAFMECAEYTPFAAARKLGSSAQIYAFEPR